MDGSFSENEVILVIMIGIVIMSIFASTFILFFYFSQKKLQSEQLLAQQREMKHREQLLYGNIQTQEVERQRIARDLHDEIGSKLNVVNLALHRVRTTENIGMLPEILGILGNVIDNTRQISHELLPPALLSFGLAAALEELCENYRKASGTDVAFQVCQDESVPDDHTVTLAIFRMVQELLSNSLKYSEADQISIQLWMGNKALKLTYQDNGKGFDPSAPAYHTGLGMQNIESRVKMIGAAHRFESALGKGVFFEIIKPRA